MRVELFLPDLDWGSVQRTARVAESMGYDALAIPEIVGDPFLAAGSAVLATERVEIGTAIAVAFPRSPTVVAAAAWALQVNSKGRFALGLGTQVKGHNERRFGVPWTAPAARLREYVEAVRAVWRTWEKREKLDYRGEHYQLTLMTPEFSPPPSGLPRVPIHLAAVRPAMISLAARVADGVRLHGFCTRRYLEEVVMPRLEEGLREVGRDRRTFEVFGGGFVATGPDAAAVAQSLETVRYRVAFYASTKAYRPVMELHGWGDLATRLYRMSVTGQWADMAKQVPDDVLEQFTAVAPFSELPAAIEKRFGGLIDTVALGGMENAEHPDLAAVLPKIRAIAAPFAGQGSGWS